MGRGSRAGKGPSQRQFRVGELVRRVLAEILSRGDVHDDVLQSHSVTITEVRPTPNLRSAQVYFLPLSGQDLQEVAVALNRHSAYLKGRISKEVHLKFAMDLHFEADQTFDEADRITALLRSDHVAPDLVAPDLVERPEED